jgi:hypothetical protein
VDELAKGMNELRAKRLLEVATYDVSGFETEAGGIKRVYARSTSKDKDGLEVSKWRTPPPPTRRTWRPTRSRTRFSRWAEWTSSSSWTSRAAGRPTAWIKPSLKVILRFDGGKPAVTFELGEKEGAAYARRVERHVDLEGGSEEDGGRGEGLQGAGA